MSLGAIGQYDGQILRILAKTKRRFGLMRVADIAAMTRDAMGKPLGLSTVFERLTRLHGLGLVEPRIEFGEARRRWRLTDQGRTLLAEARSGKSAVAPRGESTEH